MEERIWSTPLAIVAPEIQVAEEGFDVRVGDTLSWRVWPTDARTGRVAPRRSAEFHLDLYGHLFGEDPVNVRVEGVVARVEAVRSGEGRASTSVQPVASTLVDDVPDVQAFIVTLRPGARVYEGTADEASTYTTSR